jgi:hypothetical protein
MPVDNLTTEPSPSPDTSSIYSATVGDYSSDQLVHVGRLDAVKYCANPELYLTEAAGSYIPCDLYEDPDAYQIRLGRSYSSFRPYYSHLRNLIVGTALRKEIQYKNGDPGAWGDLFDNVDLEGHSLQSFAKKLFSKALDGGCAGIFVEYPKVPEGLSRAEEKQGAFRPYFVVIPAEDVLGWTSEVSATTLGDRTIYGRKLTSLRLKDEYKEPDPEDEFNEIISPAVRVYDFDGNDTRVRHRLFVSRQDGPGSEDRYALVPDKTAYLSVDIIPYVPVYGGIREAFMIARPLLLDVARLNLQHWAVTADLCNQLHYCANPKFVISGVQGGQTEFENAPDKTLILDKPDAKAEWVGAPMDGADSIMEYLASSEEAMEKLAAVAMTVNSTNQAESGFSKLLDRAQSDSLLAVLVQGLEEALNMAIDIASIYWKKPAVKVVVSKDFVPVRLHSQQILAYIELYINGVICHETFLNILDVGDVFDGLVDFDVQEELNRISADPGQTGVDVAKELEKAKGVNGRQATTKISGSRPRQSPERGSEPKESTRPSIAGG